MYLNHFFAASDEHFTLGHTRIIDALVAVLRNRNGALLGHPTRTDAPIRVVRVALVLALREDRKGGNEEVLIYVQTLPPP